MTPINKIGTSGDNRQTITPFLWYDNQAEEAATFYVSIFKNSKIGDIMHSVDEASAKAAGLPAGSALVVDFQLDGQEFSAINGGPAFKFTEAVSFVVRCENQEEVDYFWDKLLEGGQESQCGWLKDKFGLSWQITPTILLELVKDKDRAKAKRVFEAMLKMKKIDIAALKQAAEQT